MRPTPTAPRGANRWMISFGFAGVMAVAAAWWMGLLPTPRFVAEHDPAEMDEQSDPSSRSTRLSQRTEPIAEPKTAALDVEQWEPGMPISARPAPTSAQPEDFPPETVNPFASVAESLSENRTVTQAAPTNDTSTRFAARPSDPAITRVSAESTGERAVVSLAQAESILDPYADIDAAIESGRYLEAHRDLSKLYWSKPEDREQIVPRLQKTAALIYLSPQPHFMEPYVIQPGDLLQKVAPQYKISWEYLAKLNRIQPEKIRAGQKLKVVKGPFSAFVDLSDYRLTVHAHGYFVKEYAIGIGKDNSTPIGTFAVKDKLRNPVYYGPDGVIAADDPANPLGECWIDLGDSYGIHGTIDPKSIGKAESRGCIRLVADDVAEVYDFLTLGSEVVIRP